MEEVLIALDPFVVQGLTDLITETEDGVSPMTYIRSLYPRDWDHFLERMGNRLAGIEPSAVRMLLCFFRCSRLTIAHNICHMTDCTSCTRTRLVWWCSDPKWTQSARSHLSHDAHTTYGDM
jgi:hypothetical protein